MAALIFLDTSAIVALANRADEWHADAVRLYSVSGGPEHFLTHNYVVVESLSLLHRRLGLKVALRFEKESAAFEIVWIDRPLHESAVRSLARKGSRRCSLVDEVSFLVMRRRGLDTAFAFDEDFRSEGFRLLG